MEPGKIEEVGWETQQGESGRMNTHPEKEWRKKNR